MFSMNFPLDGTIGLSTQSKYASTFRNFFSAVTHNKHVDDTKHHLNTLILTIITMCFLPIIVILYLLPNPTPMVPLFQL